MRFRVYNASGEPVAPGVFKITDETYWKHIVVPCFSRPGIEDVREQYEPIPVRKLQYSNNPAYGTDEVAGTSDRYPFVADYDIQLRGPIVHLDTLRQLEQFLEQYDARAEVSTRAQMAADVGQIMFWDTDGEGDE